MWDHVYELILRLKGNAVIVGTAAYPDERSMQLASRRGLYLAEHHITLLGTNSFQWSARTHSLYLAHALPRRALSPAGLFFTCFSVPRCLYSVRCTYVHSTYDVCRMPVCWQVAAFLELHVHQKINQ